MIWCLISMVLGAGVFAAGLSFEKLLSLTPRHREEKAPEPKTETEEKLLRQWENLLEYDGTNQEVDYEDK